MCGFGGWDGPAAMTDPMRAHPAPPIQDQGNDEARYRIEAAAYIAELTADLAAMARRQGLDSLGYILEMAKLEAENVARHVDGRR